MKLVASLLITISLVFGTVAATTAYVPRLASIDSGDVLTLAAPAGVQPGEGPDDPDVPLIDPATSDGPVVLTPDLLETLRAAGVERVRVKEFAFGRWDHAWIFGLSLLGLLAGAFLVRRDATRLMKARISAGGARTVATPEQNLDAALTAVEALRAEVPGLADDDARTRRITETLDEIGRKHLAAFVEARPVLIGRLGATGYAQLMDRFAAAERQLNRAWSAAADHVLDESARCLAEGATRLGEARARLGA